MKISLKQPLFAISIWMRNSPFATYSTLILTENSCQTSIPNHTHLIKSIQNQTQMNQILTQTITNTTPINPYSFMKLIDVSISSRGSLYSSLLFIQFAQFLDTELCNTMITSYTLWDKHLHSLFVYQQMRKIGIVPNCQTFPVLIKSVAQLCYKKFGRSIHCCVIRMGFNANVYINTALVRMYCVCLSVEDARKLFDEMPERNVVSWNALITGYTHIGMFGEATDAFWEMNSDGTEPVEVTTSSVLSACAHLGALRQGKGIHDYILENRLRINVPVGTSLIYMYAKCGAIDEGEKVFREMRTKNVCTWNALISGLAMNGRGVDALQAFHEMIRENYIPDGLTFLGVLCACCDQGLVNEGRLQFMNMTQRHHLRPTIKHYCCMVDLLGRAGYLDEALGLIQQMCIEPDPAIWRALLGGCRVHKNTQLGEYAMINLIQSEPNNWKNYTMLANQYARFKKWDKVREVNELMNRRGVKKAPGCSSIEVYNLVYEFLVSDVAESGLEEVYPFLGEMKSKLTTAGYVDDIDTVLYDVEDEEKEHSLMYHSEKLALAFGILKTPPEFTLRIMKHSRICLDCHSFFKFASKAYDRNITFRDQVQIHHFVDGVCSCKDWCWC